MHTKPSGVFERLLLDFGKVYPVNSKLLGALAVATAFGIGGTAEAGHVHFGGHFGGSVHVGGGGASFHGSAGVHFASRPGFRGYRGGYGYRGYAGVRGHIYVGPSYGYYYRPYYAYGYPEYVPSYYGTSYYPVAPAPSLNSQVVVAPQPELPKFGIGLFTGASNVQDRSDSGDIGILGRFRLTEGLLVEGELGKTTYAAGSREDRRLGASLVYEIGAYNRWAPYVVGGFGVQQAQVGTANGDYSTTQDFGEIGVGLRWALTPQISLMADIRAGSRNTVSNDSPTLNNGTTAARTIAPPATTDASTSESYTRARLAAVLYF